MSWLVENTDCILDPDVDDPDTQTSPHLARVKLGEILKINDNSFELVCSDCSQAFRELIQFSIHVQEHSAGSVSSIAQLEAPACDIIDSVYVTSSSKGYRNVRYFRKCPVFWVETLTNRLSTILKMKWVMNKTNGRNHFMASMTKSRKDLPGTISSWMTRLRLQNILAICMIIISMTGMDFSNVQNANIFQPKIIMFEGISSGIWEGTFSDVQFATRKCLTFLFWANINACINCKLMATHQKTATRSEHL